MPQEPKERHSRQRQGKKRAKIGLSVPQSVLCDHCKKPKVPHHVCPNCGYYASEKIIAMKEAAKDQKETSTKDEEKR